MTLLLASPSPDSPTLQDDQKLQTQGLPSPRLQPSPRSNAILGDFVWRGEWGEEGEEREETFEIMFKALYKQNERHSKAF